MKIATIVLFTQIAIFIDQLSENRVKWFDAFCKTQGPVVAEEELEEDAREVKPVAEVNPEVAEAAL